MEKVFDLQVAGIVLVIAGIMIKFWSAVKDRLGTRWTEASDVTKEFAGYGMMVVSGLVVLASGLDMAPGFNATLPWVGRVFTCVAGGIGPSLIYDILVDVPELPSA